MATSGTGRLWKVGDVADFLNASPRTVHRRVADGTLPTIRVGALLRFDPAQVAAAVKEQEGARARTAAFVESLPEDEQAFVRELVSEFDAVLVEDTE